MKPILITIAGEPIYSYPLLMGVSWGVGYNLAKENWHKEKGEIKNFYILFLICFFFAWLGAKVFFLLFSTPDKIIEYSTQTNFWLGGGFVFYGGLTFGVLSLLTLGAFIKNFDFEDLSLFIPPLFIAHSIGRLGCLLAGCCFGATCPLPHIDRHPVQLYEAMGLFLLFLYSNKNLLRKDKVTVILSYLIGYSSLRFLLEFLRDDKIRGSYYYLSTSQWVSLFLFFVGCWLWSRRSKRNAL